METSDQHFMINTEIIKNIVSAAKITKKDIILEIGAGTGLLTKELAKRAGKLIAVEIDRRFETTLKRELVQYENVEILIGNILEIIDGMKFDKIVSNLPYSICEPILMKLAKIRFEKAVLTVPESFSRILLAKKTEEKYSKLSFISQLFFEVKQLFKVEKDAFEPKPRTNSIAIEISHRKLNKNEKILAEVMLDKRKLKNSLMEILIKTFNLTKRQAREKIKAMAIRIEILEKRPKDLELKEIEEISKNLRAK